MTVGKVFVMECPDITLNLANYIRIHGDGVTIKGTKVKINCSDAAPGKLSDSGRSCPAGAATATLCRTGSTGKTARTAGGAGGSGA